MAVPTEEELDAIRRRVIAKRGSLSDSFKDLASDRYATSKYKKTAKDVSSMIYDIDSHFRSQQYSTEGL